MDIRKLITSAVALAALAVPVTAHAQRQNRDQGGSSQRQERQERGREGRGQPRADRGSRPPDNPDAANRQGSDRRDGDRPVVAVPRVPPARTGPPPSGRNGDRRGPSRGYVAPSGRYGYRAYPYRPPTYYRPYPVRPYGYRPYVFRPRLSIGFGIYMGFPVPYPAYDPYDYSSHVYVYPQPYPVPPAGSVTAVPGPSAYGGVSLEMTPSTAAVYADGNYVGTVADFYDPSSSLSLPVGVHRIEMRAPGYEPLVFDVTIEAGQVIPYRGDLQPIR